MCSQWTVTHGGLLMSCSVSGDGKYVASASDTENGLYVNCADTGQRIHYMKGKVSETSAVICLHPSH